MLQIEVKTIQYYNIEDETIQEFLKNNDVSLEAFRDYLFEGDYFELADPTDSEIYDIFVDAPSFYRKIKKLND